MIKTWQQRCDEHPDHDGIVSEAMIRARMQEEIDELRDALEQAQPEMAPAFRSSHAYNVGFKDGLAAQQIQTVPAKNGLAEKVPAKGMLLEQTLKKAWDEMPHTALMDALVGGTGVMLGDKRIDPASIYKQQEPVAWRVVASWWDRPGKWNDMDDHERSYWEEKAASGEVEIELSYTAPRQWQGLTEAERVNVAISCGCADVAWMAFADAIEAELKAKNS